MGAWGHDTFDNDTAGDWVYGIEKASDLSLVQTTLERVLATEGEYLESDEGCEGLAAWRVGQIYASRGTGSSRGLFRFGLGPNSHPARRLAFARDDLKSHPSCDWVMDSARNGGKSR